MKQSYFKVRINDSYCEYEYGFSIDTISIEDIVDAIEAKFDIKRDYVNKVPCIVEKPIEQPINQVTTTNLDAALRIMNLNFSSENITKIVDCVKLIQEKGDNTTIKDICNIKDEWDSLPF